MTSSLGSSLFSFSIYSASSVAASKNEPVVPSLPRSRPLLHLNRCCFCFHICIFNIDCFASTPGRPFIFTASALTSALLSLLFKLRHLQCYLYCFCFHSCTACHLFLSASTCTAILYCLFLLPNQPFHSLQHCFCLPKTALPSLLFLLPHLYFISTAAAYPNLHFHLYCSWPPSLLFLILHVHYRLCYSAPTVLNVHVYCFCFHTSNFMSTASAPTPTLSSSLFLHPHLSALPYYFCFQTCTHVFRSAAPKPDLQPLLLLLPLLYFYIHFFCSYNSTSFLIPLLSQHLYFSSLLCSFLHLHFVYIASVPNTLTASAL